MHRRRSRCIDVPTLGDVAPCRCPVPMFFSPDCAAAAWVAVPDASTKANVEPALVKASMLSPPLSSLQVPPPLPLLGRASSFMRALLLMQPMSQCADAGGPILRRPGGICRPLPGRWARHRGNGGEREEQYEELPRCRLLPGRTLQPHAARPCFPGRFFLTAACLSKLVHSWRRDGREKGRPSSSTSLCRRSPYVQVGGCAPVASVPPSGGNRSQTRPPFLCYAHYHRQRWSPFHQRPCSLLLSAGE